MWTLSFQTIKNRKAVVVRHDCLVDKFDLFRDTVVNIICTHFINGIIKDKPLNFRTHKYWTSENINNSYNTIILVDEEIENLKQVNMHISYLVLFKNINFHKISVFNFQ